MNTFTLWWMLRRRSSDTKDPQALTTVLAVIAFAVTAAILLVVIGGFMAFWERSGLSLEAGGVVISEDPDTQYPLLAAIAILLILVPLVTLGGAAARLAVARRDARLAALRLAGATTGQVTVLALLDAVFQAAVGALIGIVGYAALLPLVSRLRFQGRLFEIAELWVGVPVLIGAVLGVVLVAAVSALASLRRVAVTPLGVAARQTPPGLRWVRVLVPVAAIVAMWMVNATTFSSEGAALIFILTILILGFAALNVVGPFMLWIVGKIAVARATEVSTLLAGRRIVDSPRTAWRSVGGIALATFIAGLTSAFALLDSSMARSAAEAQYMRDLQTGGYLTLAIAGVLAAVSTGVMQAGRVIDQRMEYRALVLAGTEVRTLDRARFRETLIPLTASVGIATCTALLLLGPLLGMGTFTKMSVVVQFLGCVAGAYALVLLGAGAARRVSRTVLATAGAV